MYDLDYEKAKENSRMVRITTGVWLVDIVSEALIIAALLKYVLNY